MKNTAYIFRLLIILCIITVIIVFVSIDWWGCKTEFITNPVSTIPTADIVKEVATANTVEKAIVAIQHLIQKIGFGYSYEQSKYGKYAINGEQITNIAKIHSEYIRGDTISTYNIGELYDSILVLTSELSIININEWIFTGNLNESLNTLQVQSQNALGDIESPNNSLLINIIAENGVIPTQVPLYDSTKVKSPIQVFLLTIWIITEFERYQTIIDKFSWCKALCTGGYVACLGVCWIIEKKIPSSGPTCRAICAAAYTYCLSLCHDQGGGDVTKKPILK